MWPFVGIYVYNIYDKSNGREIIGLRPGTQEGERGIVNPVTARGTGTARVRDQPIDRAALGRDAEVQRGVVLSTAVPAGEAPVDRGPVGREGRAAEAAVLQADGLGKKDAQGAAADLGGVCRSDAEDHGSGAAGVALSAVRSPFQNQSVWGTRLGEE